jgi:hypothetical protein
MTKTCNHHFLVNQEKGEKHVFRKSKKYRTLCSVALGTMVTAVVAWGGTVAHADEVTPSVDTTIQRTENPATNLPEAQPNSVSEQTESLALTGQSNGAIAVTVPHDTVTQAVEEAKAEGISTVEDSPMDLGNTTSATETNQQISKAEADAQKQVEVINEVTETYKADKATYESNKARIEQENKELSQAYEGANQTGKEINAWVDTKFNNLKAQYADADVTVNEQVVSSGNGTSVSDYINYGKTAETIQSTNEQALGDYLTKKTKADEIVAKNQAIQKENEAGLAKAKADNEAIERRNQAGQAAVDAENRAGQAAVDQANQEKQQLVSDRVAEIEAITKRNQAKEVAARKENEAIDAYNAKEMERYQRDLAEISKGEEGYISEALAQALNLNNGEPQAQHGAITRNPDQIISTGDAMLGGYSRILDSTGFFVYDSFKTGETLSFNYQNLQNARFDGKKISRVTYDITNLVSPAGTDAVKLVVPNDPTEGFIAYRNDGNGDWRTDKMEFRVVAKYFLEDDSQVTFSKEKPGVFTHSSLNHNDIGLEYVKDTSGKFVPINGSTVQVTNEGLARSLGSNRASDLNLPEEWDTTSSRYAYKGAIVSTVTSGNTYTVTFGQGDMPQNVGLSYWFALNTLPVARTVTPYSPKPHVTVELEPIPEPITVTPDVFTPKTFTPEKPVTFTPKPLEEVVQPSLTLTKVTLPVKPIPKELFDLPESLIPLTKEALEYLERRRVEPEDTWMFSNSVINIGEVVLHLKNHIIIPFLYMNRLYGFQAVSIDKKQYFIYLPKENYGFKLWNFYNVPIDSQVFFFESVFDAKSSGLENIISILGISIDNKIKELFKDRVFVFDNQRCDARSYEETEKLLKEGEKVLVWPKESEQYKDLNDLVKAGASRDKVATFIRKNIYSGMEGLLKLKLG